MAWSREEAWIAAFTGAYMLAALAGALLNGNREFLYYLVVMVVLILAVLAVHFRVRFRPAVLAGLSLWGAAHMAGGLLPVGDSVLYNLWLIPERLKYDQLVHALGFGLTTWVCWEALRPSLRDSRARLGPLVLCAAAGCGFGAFNEVVEFIAVLTIPNTNVGGYENTGWDLVANLVGSVSAAFLIARLDRRG
jgi:hypothetical protein